MGGRSSTRREAGTLIAQRGTYTAILRLFQESGRRAFWCNRDNSRRTAVPRHNEINDFTARSICRNLAVPPPR